MVREIHGAAGSATAVSSAAHLTTRVLLGDSTNLPGHRLEPDLVLGSPPYCTRIDYAMATRVELSVLGLSVSEQVTLRRSLLGTTTVPPVSPVLSPAIGDTARRTLDAIRDHPSKASRTYYAKSFAHYLAGYTTSLQQISAVASPSGTIGLVVQDSYYKELRVDLAAITNDILEGFGWHLYHSFSFSPRRSIANINPRAVAYRENGVTPLEQALFFRSE